MGGQRISKGKKQKVLEMLDHGFRSGHISKTLGLTRSSVEQWQHMYDGGDTSWVSSSRMPASDMFTEEEKARAARDCAEGKSTLAAKCREMKISKSVLHVWIRNYNRYGVCTLKRGRRPKGGSHDGGTEADRGTQEAAERERARGHLLEGSLPGLGRRVAEGRVKKKDFFETIDRCRRLGIPVSKSLEVAGVASSSYYYWRSHPETESEEDALLATYIRQAQEENYWDYGAKTMAQYLVREKKYYEKLNHKRVERIMDEYGLHAKVRLRRFPRNYYRTIRNNADELPANILNREFTPSGPGEKFVTDITYVPTDKGWAYLAVIKDLYNREIADWQLEEHITVRMTEKIVNRLLKSGRMHEGSMLHSDQGWNYTHRGFVRFLRKKGVVQSMSRRGNCWDNACMENFFGFLKTDTFRQMKGRGKDLSFKETKKVVEDYILWYNNKRIQKKLDYKTPVGYLRSVV